MSKEYIINYNGKTLESDYQTTDEVMRAVIMSHIMQIIDSERDSFSGDDTTVGPNKFTMTVKEVESDKMGETDSIEVAIAIDMTKWSLDNLDKLEECCLNTLQQSYFDGGLEFVFRNPKLLN